VKTIYLNKQEEKTIYTSDFGLKLALHHPSQIDEEEKRKWVVELLGFESVVNFFILF